MVIKVTEAANLQTLHSLSAIHECNQNDTNRLYKTHSLKLRPYITPNIVPIKGESHLPLYSII